MKLKLKNLFSWFGNFANVYCKIWDALRDLVPFVQFVQFKKRQKNPMEECYILYSFGFQPATLLRGCFLRYLNCTNGTKSPKTSSFWNSVCHWWRHYPKVGSNMVKKSFQTLTHTHTHTKLVKVGRYAIHLNDLLSNAELMTVMVIFLLFQRWCKFLNHNWKVSTNILRKF